MKNCETNCAEIKAINCSTFYAIIKENKILKLYGIWDQCCHYNLVGKLLVCWPKARATRLGSDISIKNDI